MTAAVNRRPLWHRHVVASQNPTREQFDELSPRSKSSIFKMTTTGKVYPALEAQLAQLAKIDSTSSYCGHKQPPPAERLRQAKIFLSDEDYHRNLNFERKIADIEAYLIFLEKNQHSEEFLLIKEIKEMISVHKTWINTATEVPTMLFEFAQFDHKNRLLDYIKDNKTREEIRKVKAPALSRELNLDSAPALHKYIDETAHPPEKDPFFYTKKIAEIHREQISKAATLRKLNIKENSSFPGFISAPLNFNGPFIPIRHENSMDLDGADILAIDQNAAIHVLKENVDREVPSITVLAKPLNPNKEKALGEAEAVQLLQDQICIEANRNWGPRSPNFARVWAFIEDVKTPKTFFSLERWPLQLQTPMRRNEIEASGPKPHSPAKYLTRKEYDEMRRSSYIPTDPRETYYPGETLFPFGETVIQQAIESRRIEDALANVPEFAHLYTTDENGEKILKRAARTSDPFALPPLPDDFDETMHDVPSTLREDPPSHMKRDNLPTTKNILSLISNRKAQMAELNLIVDTSNVPSTKDAGVRKSTGTLKSADGSQSGGSDGNADTPLTSVDLEGFGDGLRERNWSRMSEGGGDTGVKRKRGNSFGEVAEGE